MVIPWVTLITAAFAQHYQSEIQGPEFDFVISFLRSDGDLAGEVEIIDQNVVRIARNAESDAESVNTGMDTVVEGLVKDVNATISMEIAEIEQEIMRANEELVTVEGAVLLPSDPCDVYAGCEVCTSDPACVWCASTNQCMLGDETGVFGFVCEEFDYESCAVVGCERIADCSGCVNTPGCGWCGDTWECMTGSPADSGDCEPTLWQTGPHSLCPLSTSIGHPQPVDSSLSSPSPNHLSQDYLNSLKDYIEELEFQLRYLTDIQANLGNDLDDLMQLNLNETEIQSNALFLGDVVDETSEENVESDLDDALQQGLVTVQGLNTTQAVVQSISDRISAEDSSLRPALSNTNRTEERIREGYSNIMRLIRSNEARMRREIDAENRRAARNETEGVPQETGTGTRNQEST